MKLILIVILFSTTLIVSIQSNAQEADTTQELAILKVDNSLRKGQIKWLNRKGFDSQAYDWNDPTINLYLNKATKRHSKANWIGIVGGSIFVLGLAANAMGSLSKSISDSNPDEPYQVVKGPYYLGGAMIATSVVLSFDSIAKLNRAKVTREKKFK